MKLALSTGVKASVQVFLRMGGDANATDAEGRTMLSLAASKGHIEICKLLLKAGADPGVKGSEGKTAMQLAIQSGHTEIASLLQEHERSTERNPAGDSVAVSSPNSKYESEAQEFHATNGQMDLSGWEEDEPSAAPASNGAVIERTLVLQRHITSHIPIDRDQDWSEIEIDLPLVTRRRAVKRAISTADSRKARTLFDEAISNGTIPSWRVAEAARGDEGEIDVLFETQLRVVLDDLNIAIEDDNYWGWYNAEYVGPKNRATKLKVKKAIRFLNRLVSTDDDPLWIL
jgi:RNA polymerase primary sigma factor